MSENPMPEALSLAITRDEPAHVEYGDERLRARVYLIPEYRAVRGSRITVSAFYLHWEDGIGLNEWWARFSTLDAAKARLIRLIAGDGEPLPTIQNVLDQLDGSGLVVTDDEIVEQGLRALRLNLGSVVVAS